MEAYFFKIMEAYFFHWNNNQYLFDICSSYSYFLCPEQILSISYNYFLRPKQIVSL